MILLDITLANGWLIIVGLISAIFIYNYYNTVTALTITKQKLSQNEIENKRKEAELKLEMQTWAISEFEKFKNAEIENINITAKSQALNAARVVLQEWKIENEAKIRQDAINRSYSVNMGKITEHLVPFSSSFLSQFNPKDARFIGSPIDLIVFDGCADKKDDIITYFVEIKTGNSKLTDLQKKIKASIIKGEVRWAEINPDNERPITIEYQDKKLKPITKPEEVKRVNDLFEQLKIGLE